MRSVPYAQQPGKRIGQKIERDINLGGLTEDENLGHASEEHGWSTHVRKPAMAWQFLFAILKIADSALFQQIFSIRGPSPSRLGKSFIRRGLPHS